MNDCPGHVARDDNAKICRYCGTHVDEERPDVQDLEAEQLLSHAEHRLHNLNWRDTVPDDLQSEVLMAFNEALAGGPNMNGDGGPILTVNHALDCIYAVRVIAALRGQGINQL